jgi:hypothetical protein
MAVAHRSRFEVTKSGNSETFFVFGDFQTCDTVSVEITAKCGICVSCTAPDKREVGGGSSKLHKCDPVHGVVSRTRKAMPVGRPCDLTALQRQLRGASRGDVRDDEHRLLLPGQLVAGKVGDAWTNFWVQLRRTDCKRPISLAVIGIIS